MPTAIPMPTPRVATTPNANPGARRSRRTAKRASGARLSSWATPRASCTSSRYRCVPPKRSKAARRASAAVMPRRVFSAVSISIWKANSSLSSAAKRARRRNSARMRVSAARAWCSMESALGREDEPDRADESVPGRELLSQRASSGGGEPVVLRAPAVLGDAPLRIDPAPLLEPDERRVDGALPYLQRVLGELLDAVGESPSVHRRERERFEDDQVERALQNLFIGGGLGHGASSRMTGGRLPHSSRMSREEPRKRVGRMARDAWCSLRRRCSWLLTDNFVVAPPRSFAHMTGRLTSSSLGLRCSDAKAQLPAA